ncbi:MAG: PilZ domain-containing protein [Candidatus Binatia bacterium]
MAVIDRRKGNDRRRHERHAVRIDVDWENPMGKRAARISDVSVSGCFLLSSGEVDDGQIVKVLFPLSDGRRALFWGKIVNHVFDVGFGLKFVAITDMQQSLLKRLIGKLEHKPAGNI